MLEVKNLSVSIHGKPILEGLDLTVKAGEVAAIMGPNGSGKSTLSYVIAGKPDYEVTGGEVLLDGENILELEPDERAAKGVFLAFQYPIEIPGVATMTFLKAALNAQRRARGEERSDDARLHARGARRGRAPEDRSGDAASAPLNVGFSGGEKKRMEILQMALLEPRLAILDETDSGLDIDALRIVADGVNALRDPNRAFLVITHYQRLLDYIRPDIVHVMAKGRIVKSGGPELALELERNGYRDYAATRREDAMTAASRHAKTAAETTLAEQFAALARRATRTDARRLPPLSRPTGLPTRRDEAWHYTDLRAAMRERGAARAGARRAAIAAARELSATRAPVGDARLVARRWPLRRGTLRPRRRRACSPRSLGEIASPAGADADAVVALNDALPPGGCADGRRGRQAGRARSRSSISRAPTRRGRSIRASRSRSAPARARAFVETLHRRGAGDAAQCADDDRASATGAQLAHVSLIEDDAGPASRKPDRRARRRARSSTPSRWSPAARSCAGRFSPASTGADAKIALGGLVAARRTPPRRHDARRRARRAARREPRILPPHRRRRGDRRLSGQGDRRAAARRRPTAA